MNDMTRTHWLLVVLIGVVLWIGGRMLDGPEQSVGFVVCLLGVVGALFGQPRQRRN